MNKTALLSFSLLSTVAFALPGDKATLSGADHTEGAISVEQPVTLETPEQTQPSAIINGTSASADIYPMTGALVMDVVVAPLDPFSGQQLPEQALRGHACSSTLIAPDVVLLAAHCVDEYALAQGGTVSQAEFYWSRKSLVPSAGTTLTLPGLPDDAVKAVDIIVPVEWNIQNIGGGGFLGGEANIDNPEYDIALMFLETPIEDVEPAFLLSPEEASYLEDGVEVDIVGWGIQEPIGIFEQFSGAPTTSGEKMWGTSILTNIGESKYLVGPDSDDVRQCKGDSGGPTFLKLDGRDDPESLRVLGVVSHADNLTLCQSTGGYSTRADFYYEWIDNEMRKGCEDGIRSWCPSANEDGPNGKGIENWGIIQPGPSKGCSMSGSSPAGAVALLSLFALAGRRRRD